MPNHRIHLDLSPEAADEMERLQQASGSENFEQMTAAALKLMRDVINAQKEGKSVVMMDPKTGETEELPPIGR
jgi:hypothetical protein